MSEDNVTKKNPDYDMDDDEEEEGITSLFAKWNKEKLSGGKKKRFAEVE